MNLNLLHKNAVVCGSTQGLGWATAVELALLGANVTLVARNEAKLQARLLELDSSQGQQHHYLVADFTHPEQVKAAIHTYVAEHRVGHILVNNTGGPAGGPVAEAELSAFEAAFASHLLCNQLLVQALVPGMKAAGFGRIINIISTSVKQPINGLGVSNTIRAAVASWGKTLANELGPYGITVNNVLPGFTKTQRYNYVIDSRATGSGKTFDEVEASLTAEIPARRIGLAEEFGAAAAFLCTPAAAYINGINLPIDGGRLGTL
jgi:3-oxoacyl-[acyl-carrier protein] reductase